MSITSKDVRDAQFHRQLRGYAIEEVDDLLDAVCAELDRLDAVIKAYQERFGSLDAPAF